MEQSITNNRQNAKSRLKESGNVFLALFGAIAIVGVVGGTAAGIMRGPMKTMTDISSRAVAENEIMANTKMSVMAIAKPAFTKDCDNDGAVEAWPYDSNATGKIGGTPTGGGYIPTEFDIQRLTDPWGNHYTYCVWDHGTLVDDATCGGTSQNRLPGLNTTTYPTGDVNKQTFIAIISSGANRVYETTCQDWATADANADGDLDDVGDTQLALRPDGSDDILMTYSYAEAAMATSANWRLQSSTTDTAEIIEDDVEIGGDTVSGDGVSTTIAGSVNALGGLKLASDPGDDSISGPCNAANDQALRINTGGATKALEICTGGAWTAISGSSTSSSCEITAPIVADSGNAFLQNNTLLDNALGLAVQGNYAYITSFDSNTFTVVDISNPLNPIIANSGNAFVTDNTKLSGPQEVYISGNYAYVISLIGNSLTVVDISDPLNPIIPNGGNAWLQDATKLDRPTDIEILGNYAYITSNGNSLTVVDISDPLNPIIPNGGNAWLQDATKLGQAFGLEITGNYAYVAAALSNSLTVVDISDPLNPIIANAGNAWVKDNTQLKFASDVEISGNYAYVTASGSESFTVVDISDPLNPFIVGSLTDPSKLDGPIDLEIIDKYGIVASFSSDSITVIDISNPINPIIADNGNAWIQNNTILNDAWGLEIDGRFAYVASGIANRFVVIDLGCDTGLFGITEIGSDIGFDPELANCVAGNDGPPVLQASLPISAGGRLWADGTNIFINNGTPRLHALTFDGSTITLQDTVTTGSANANAIWSDGQYIIRAEGFNFEVYSFDGSTLNLVSTLPGVSSQGFNTWHDGQYIYVANNTLIRALEFNDGILTQVGSSYSMGGNTRGIWGDGSYIYTSQGGGNNVLRAFTFDGNNFTLVGEQILDDNGRSVTVHNGYIIVSDGIATQNLKAYSFDGQNFTFLDNYNSGSISDHVVSDGRYIYYSGGNHTAVLEFDGSQFSAVNTLTPSGSNSEMFFDGRYLYVLTDSEISIYSGFECTKAGLKTPGTAIEMDYTAEQLFSSTTNATGSAESYGTAILLKNAEFGDEAGVSFNVASGPTDTSIPTAAITGVLTDTDGSGALAFKTKDSNDELKTQMIIDSDGQLGLDIDVPAYNVDADLQIGALTSTDQTTFDPDVGNCVRSNTGPFVLAGSINTSGSAVGLWHDGTYIYVADGSFGVHAYTFDGTTFTLLDTFDTPGTVNNIKGDGTYIYVADGSSGVRALTFDGTTFTDVASTSVVPDGRDVWAKGDYLYVASGTSGIYAFTFDGTTFTNVGISTIAHTYYLWSDGQYLYGADGGDAVKAYTFDGSIFTEIASHAFTTDPIDLWFGGGYAFTPHGSAGGGIIATSFDGSSFRQVDNANIAGSPRGVWSDGNTIFAANNNSGVSAYSFDGETLTGINSLDATAGSTRFVFGDGTYIYAIDNVDGLVAYSGFECTQIGGWVGPTEGLLTSDIQALGFDPEAANCVKNESGSPAEIATSSGLTVEDIWTDGKYIWASLSNDGFAVYDFDGISFTLIDTFDTAGQVRGLWGDDNYMYVADRGGGIRAYTFDGSTITEIAFETSIDQAAGAWSDGTYLYVANGIRGIAAYTFDGSTFTLIDTIDSPDNTNNIMGDGTYIYTSDGDGGVDAYSFDGTTLTLLDEFPVTSGAQSVWVEDGYIFAAASNDGIYALTFDGTSFTLVDNFDTLGESRGIWGDGTYIYAADFTGDVIVFSFDGSEFTEVVTATTTSSARDVWGDGKYIYASMGGSGISALSGFACLETDQGSIGSIGFFGQDGVGDVDTNILFSQGLDLKGTNSDASTLVDMLSVDDTGTSTFKQGGLDIVDEAGAFNFLSRSILSDEATSLTLNRSKGTLSARTAVGSGDILGALLWSAYDGASVGTGGHAAIYAKATGSVSNGRIPSGIFFNTAPGGDALNSASELAILSTGLTGVDTDAPTEALHVAGRIAISEGLRIGNDNKCSTSYDQGFIRYDANVDALEYCTGSEWINLTQNSEEYIEEFDPEAANCVRNNGGPFVEAGSVSISGTVRGVWTDGTYVYASNNTGSIGAYSFNGISFTTIDSETLGSFGRGVWGDGTYIYGASHTAGGLDAFTFNGTSLTVAGSTVTSGTAFNVWGDGTYLYVADDNTGGIIAYTFNGTAFTQVGNSTAGGSVVDVWGDGSYIYTADGADGIYAYTFNGTAFTQVGSYNTAGSASGIWGDGTYIYIADGSDGFKALNFDGSTFTLLGSINPSGDEASIWGDGVYIYGANSADGITALSFNGTAFNIVGSFDTSGTAVDIYGDGSFLYVADTSGDLRAYSGFECLESNQDKNSEPLINWEGADKTELKITASDGAANDLFGTNVSISENYALIGAYGDDSSQGSAYIFDITTDTEVHKLTASDGVAIDLFGLSVSIDGNYALIGAFGDDSLQGAAYLYDVTSGAEIRKLTASDGAASDYFGGAVSISENYALVGAFRDDSLQGAAYLYDVTSGTELFKLTASDGVAIDLFGASVAIDGNYALIGANGDDSNQGSAYIFDITTGTELFKLTASDGAASDAFGGAVSISGNYALIGTNGDDSNQGSAYIFDITTGTELFKLTASDGTAGDRFGSSVSMSGNYALIGTNGDDSNQGSAYIFDITTGTEIRKISASDGAGNDQFGGVSIEGNYALIGANGDDSNQGSAYLFQGNWTDRYEAGTECYPDDLTISNINGATASSTVTTASITVSGFVRDCTLTLSSESGTIDIIKNSTAVGLPYVDVSTGDTIELQIESSGTSGASLNNIVTLGDKRALFTVTTQ
ncbi:MAG: hypothetical protein AAF988_00440 [Pseudomonadota bacterium]